MRILVDISDKQIQELNLICEMKNISRAEAIRQAIASFVDKNKTEVGEAFGLWEKTPLDGLSYQESARLEW